MIGVNLSTGFTAVVAVIALDYIPSRRCGCSGESGRARRMTQRYQQDLFLAKKRQRVLKMWATISRMWRNENNQKQVHPIPRLQGDQPFRGALREEQRKDRRRDNQSRSDSFTAVCRAYGSFCGGYLLYTVVASGICTFRFLRVVYC